MTGPQSGTPMTIYYRDLDASSKSITIDGQYVTFYETGLVFAYSPDGGVTPYTYIFQPWAYIYRISSTTSVGWR